MKISNEESLRASRIAPINPAQSGSVPTPKSAAAPGEGPAAKVEISDQAKTLAAAKAEASHYLPAVQNAPDTHAELVDRLKTQVANGTYHVSSADIAEQIVRRAKADNTAN
jgi:flagellar biosynthesis anti-sigma factor FlgM